jgi:5-methylcytosine-specific restriction endonuclease McrA
MPLSDPTARAKYQVAYHKKHAKRLNMYAASYRSTHREEAAEYLQDWKKDNPDYDKEWRAANRRKKNKNQQTYRRRHPEKIRVLNANYATRKTKAGGHLSEAQWLELCSKHNHRCLRCKKRKKLTPDHIIPVSKGGTSNVENIQPLCKSCNSIKNDGTTDYR